MVIRSCLPSLLSFWWGAAGLAIPVDVNVDIVGTRVNEAGTAILRAESQPPSNEAEGLALQVAAPGRQTLDLEPGIWSFQAEATGYWSEAQVVSIREDEKVALQIRLFPTGTLRGRIEAPRGQKPPDRLEVRFESDAQSPQGVVTCPVRSEVWACAVPAGISDLRLRAEAMVPLYRWGVRIEAGKVTELGVLALRPGASVIGRVLTEAGLAANAKVELAPERLGTLGVLSTEKRLDALSLAAQTNEKGFFQFQGVAPGTYGVTASVPGMAPARISPVLVREALESEILDPLVLAKPVTLRVVLSPPVDPQGLPWRVRLLKESNAGGLLGRAGEGAADAAGNWAQSNLAPGKYRIMVLGDLESRWIEQEIEVLPGDVPVPIDIPVVEVRGLLTIGKSPLAGTLWFGGRSGPRRIRFEADEEGAFSGFLPEEGTWTVDLVNDSEDLRVALEPVEVRVPRGKRSAQVEIRVPDTTLEGEAVDEAGRAVPGTYVGLSGSRKSSRVTTGDEGTFRVRGLAPGSVFVEAEEGNRSAGPYEISIEEGRKLPWLRLVLRGTLEVRGHVVSAVGPVPGAEIMAWPSLEAVGFASGASTVTGPDGSFSLSFPAQTRSITLCVFAAGHAFHMGRFPVEPGGSLTVPVAATGGTLILELPRGEGDTPRPAPQLVHGGTFTPLLLLTKWTSLQRFQQTDPGKLVVPNVESGDWSLCAGAGTELRQGKEPPAGRCVSGFLAPHGELTLALPREPV